MAAFHADLSITATTTYNTTPDVDIATGPANKFDPDEVFMAVESAHVVAFSFDGKNDHGRLKNDVAPLYFSHQRKSRAQRIWFRNISGAGASTIRASLWTHR